MTASDAALIAAIISNSTALLIFMVVAPFESNYGGGRGPQVLV